MVDKSYCTPEAYRGDTCFGFFTIAGMELRDVPATSDIFTALNIPRVAYFDDDRTAGRNLPVRQRPNPHKLTASAQRAIQGCRRGGPACGSARMESPRWMGVDTGISMAQATGVSHYIDKQ